ncbi:MAG: rod shape-determining protein MreC [Acidimicrobiales bacterium]
MTLLVLVLLSVSIITLDETGRASVLTTGAKSVASDIYSPLRSGVNGVLDPIGRFFVGALHYGSVERENQKLRAQIVALEESHAQTEASARQYHQLEQLLEINKLPSLANLQVVPAEVTAQDISDFASTITIDAGRDSGVAVGDAVVGPGGLVGQVIETYHHEAQVRLLTDAKSRIGVSFGTHEVTTLDGTPSSHELAAENISTTTAVSKGQLMVTSSLSGAEFPAGIPVARVTSVHSVVGAADKQVRASPLAPMSGLSYVEVLVWSGSSGASGTSS